MTGAAAVVHGGTGPVRKDGTRIPANTCGSRDGGEPTLNENQSHFASGSDRQSTPCLTSNRTQRREGTLSGLRDDRARGNADSRAASRAGAQGLRSNSLDLDVPSTVRQQRRTTIDKLSSNRRSGTAGHDRPMTLRHSPDLGVLRPCSSDRLKNQNQATRRQRQQPAEQKNRHKVVVVEAQARIGDAVLHGALCANAEVDLTRVDEQCDPGDQNHDRYTPAPSTRTRKCGQQNKWQAQRHQPPARLHDFP